MRPALLPCLALVIGSLASPGHASPPHSYSADDKIDATARAQVVNALADQMRDRYVLADEEAHVAQVLRDKLASGGYDSVRYASGLASVLSTDLRTTAHDVHLWVEYGDLPAEDNTRDTGLGTPETLPGQHRLPRNPRIHARQERASGHGRRHGAAGRQRGLDH